MLKIRKLKHNLFRIVLTAGVGLTMIGCSQVPETQERSVSPTEGDATEMSQPLPTPATSGLQTLIEKAKSDLAQRLSVATDQINLIEATAVVWPDSSLGCPQEGMVYAQVLTPGFLILLEHAGNISEYHTSSGTEIVTCENPSPPVPGIPGNT